MNMLRAGLEHALFGLTFKGAVKPYQNANILDLMQSDLVLANGRPHSADCHTTGTPRCLDHFLLRLLDCKIPQHKNLMLNGHCGCATVWCCYRAKRRQNFQPDFFYGLLLLCT